MRLLPRTVRGTWLLAATAWLCGCAAVWWLLPPQPRLQWHDVPPIAWARVKESSSAEPVLVPPLPSAVPPQPNMLVVWDSVTGQVRELFSDEDDLPAFAFSPGGDWLLLDVDNHIQLRPIFQTGAGADLQVTDCPPDGWRRRYEFTPNGGLLAYSDWVAGHAIVRLFDMRTLKQAGTVPEAEAPLAFAADGRTFAYRAGGECHVVEWPSKTERGHVPDDGAARYELSATGDRLFQFHQTSSENRVACWDVVPAERRWEIATHPDTAVPGESTRLFSFLPNDDLWPAEVTVIDASDGQSRGHLQLAADEWVANFQQACSPLGPVVAVASSTPGDSLGQWLENWLPRLGVRARPGRVRLVDVTNGRTVCDIPGGSGVPSFTPDGNLLVREESTITLWDVPPHKPLTWFAAAAGLFAGPAFGLAWRRSRRLRRGVA